MWLKDQNKILEWIRLIHNFKPLENELDFSALKRISGNPEKINDDTAQELTAQFMSMLDENINNLELFCEKNYKFINKVAY